MAAQQHFGELYFGYFRILVEGGYAIGSRGLALSGQNKTMI